MSFTPLKGSCPVCVGARRDCRQSGDLIFCRTENPSPDYIFKRYDAHGFGIFVEKALQDQQDADRREEYRRERELKNRQRLAEEAKRHAQSLPAEERDREIRKLLGQLPLKPEHRADLRRRGLSDEAIAQGMFRSIDRWQKLDQPISSRLAGVSIDGRSLTHAQSGYICPVWNTEGLIIGWQLRLDDASEGGKYRWPSSAGKKRPNGPTAHLPNGELPITFCRPQRTPKGIGLIEGILKPAIAAHLSGYVMVGAAGGQFQVSQRQLREGLAKFSAELGINQITYIPDAGGIANKQVYRRDCGTIRLIRSWGYEVVVADWGQFYDKSQPDYDELLASGGEVQRFIPAAEYLGEEAEPLEAEPDPEEYKLWIEAQEEWEAAQDAIAADQLERWKRSQKEAREAEKEARKELAYQIYHQLSELTVSDAWLTICTPNLDSLPELQNLPKGAIYILVSPKGTAKTQAVIPYIKQADAAYYPTSRKSLGREAGRRIGVVWHTDLGARNKVAFCINSAWKADFSPGNLRKKGVLFLDELPELMSHLFGSTCNKDGRRPWILSALKAMILAAIEDGYVFAASEDITDCEIDYLRELVPDVPVRLIVNTYQPEGYNCYFYSQKAEDAIAKIEAELEEPEANLLVFDDFKDGAVGARSLANFVASKMPDIAPYINEINADTSGSDEIQSYIANFNTSPRENKTRLCACTPSVVSGISNTDNWFTSIWGISNGILMPNDISQALLRVRDKRIPRHVCVAEQAPHFMMEAGGAITPEEVDSYFNNNLNASAKLMSGFGVEYDLSRDAWTSPHWRYYCRLVAKRNCARLNLRRLTREKLEAEGHNIIDIDIDRDRDTGKATLIELKGSWGELKQEDYAAIEAAELIDDKQLEILKEKENPSPSEVIKLKKKVLQLSYGSALIEAVGGYAGVPEDPNKPGICELDNRGRWKRQLENLYLLTRPNALEAAARKDEGKLRSQLWHEMGYFPADQSWHTRRTKALQAIGIQDFLERQSEAQAWGAEDTKEMCTRKNQRAKAYSEALGVGLGNLGGNALAGTLIELLGLKTASIQVREGDKRSRKYWIDDRSWELAQLYIQHREAQQQATSACHTPLVNIYDLGFSTEGCDTTEASACHTPPVNIYEAGFFEGVCDTHEEPCNKAFSGLADVPSHRPSAPDEVLARWMEPESIAEIAEWLAEPDRPTFEALIPELGIPVLAIKEAMKRLADDVRDRCLNWLGWGESSQEWGWCDG